MGRVEFIQKCDSSHVAKRFWYSTSEFVGSNATVRVRKTLLKKQCALYSIRENGAGYSSTEEIVLNAAVM